MFSTKRTCQIGVKPLPPMAKRWIAVVTPGLWTAAAGFLAVVVVVALFRTVSAQGIVAFARPWVTQPMTGVVLLLVIIAAPAMCTGDGEKTKRIVFLMIFSLGMLVGALNFAIWLLE